MRELKPVLLSPEAQRDAKAEAQFCCVCFRGLKSFTSRGKPSEAQKRTWFGSRLKLGEKCESKCVLLRVT